MRRSFPWASLVLVGGIAAGCHARSPEPADAGTPPPDWSRFSGRNRLPGNQPMRPVPEVAQEVTGIPYIRAFRLGWTRSPEVPTFEPDKQTRSIPDDALQAVLELDVRKLPADVDLEVQWYYDAMPGGPIYTDGLTSRGDGEHTFALVMREEGRLVPLPEGSYRVEVRNGSDLLKTIPFEVGR